MSMVWCWKQKTTLDNQYMRLVNQGMLVLFSQIKPTYRHILVFYNSGLNIQSRTPKNLLFLKHGGPECIRYGLPNNLLCIKTLIFNKMQHIMKNVSSVSTATCMNCQLDKTYIVASAGTQSNNSDRDKNS